MGFSRLFVGLATISLFSTLPMVHTAQQKGGGATIPPPAGGTWQRTASNPAGGIGLSLLLTDGTVLVQRAETATWYKLTPDINGSYVNGTWSQVASTAADYGPLYFGSSVLANGKVVVIGGEYNLTGNGVWTNKGATYDPVTNVWSVLAPPANWANIGDCQCTVMPDGRFFVCNPLDRRMASLDPNTLTWTPLLSTDKRDRFDEEGWVLMPDGTILTVDAINAPACERYIPALDQWILAGSTPQSLVDAPSQEIGPMVLLPNGKVFAMGATGHNAVYTPGASFMDPGTWTAAPDFPTIAQGQLDIADGPACLLPNGNVLCVASPGVFNSPSRFFEFDGTSLVQVTAVPRSSGNPSYVGNMLMLPTGQVMFTDFSQDVEIYTPTGGPQDPWRPTITSFPLGATAGKTYQIVGTQFNGLSQCTAYGDDSTNFTNYPIVRIINNATGHVKYCRTHDHSTMGVATGSASVWTYVDIPTGVEIGPSTLQVVANGIPSLSRTVYTAPQNIVLPTTLTLVTGLRGTGTLPDVFYTDSSVVSAMIDPSGTRQSPQIKYEMVSTSPTISPSSFQFMFTAKAGVAGAVQKVFFYNYVTNDFEEVDSRATTTTDQAVTITPSGSLDRFVNPASGEVKVVMAFYSSSDATFRWTAAINLANWKIQ